MRSDTLRDKETIMSKQREAWLDRLMAAYRETFHDLDASPQFVPSIWARIDGERQLGWVWPMRQWATRLVGAAVAAIFILGAVLSLSNSNQTLNVREASYVDALTEDSFDQGEGDFLLVAGKGR